MSAADDAAPRGIDGTEVQRVVAGELAALVSTLDAAAYAGDAVAENTADPDWLAPRAVTHDAVVTWASDTGPVVPLPMWVMFEEPAGVAAMLQQRAALFARGLDSVRDAREYGVRVTADRQALAEAAVTLDPTLAALQLQAQGASPGQAYLLRRKLADARKSAARDVAGRIAGEVHTQLSNAARSSALRATSGGAPDAVADSSIILDGAYLVPNDRYDDFRRGLTQLIERYRAHGCRFDFTGPWPPYHFVRGNE